MAQLDLIFLVAFFLFEMLAAVGVPSGKYSFIGAGLACYAASILFGS